MSGDERVEELVIVGVSHKTAPLHLRERLAFDEKACTTLLDDLALMGGRGAVLLSTCNRVELYGAGLTSAQPHQTSSHHAELVECLARQAGLSSDELAEYLYVYRGDQALRHLFRVAASLDSMVVGEPQILGQLKTALDQSRSQGSAGQVERYMERAFTVARRVRNQTGIGRNVVSISSVAVRLARQIFEDLHQRTTLLIGAGEMGELAARHLCQEGVGRLLVANRSFDRAAELAEQLNGHPRALTELPQLLTQADIVITSTGAREPIIDVQLTQAAIKARKYKPLFLIDIAVPRNIAPEVNELDHVYLYDVDDLTQIAADNLAQREQEADEAEQLIIEEVSRFHTDRAQRSVGPMIKSLRDRAHGIKDQEVAWAIKGTPDLTSEQEERVRRLGDRIVNKLLHDVFTGMKKLAAEPEREQMLGVVSELFKLEQEDEKSEQLSGERED